jgi:hypothetical protein
MTLVPTRALPSLIAAITGGPIAGSWWSHPRGKDIFAIASALEDSADVLVGKLVDGKVTFVHRRLWPALYRVVSDPETRAARVRGLSAAATALLARVEAAGTLRGADRAARKPLEERALVHSISEHTASGHHETVLTAWPAWAPPAIAAAAAALSLDAARAALAAAGIPL